MKTPQIEPLKAAARFKNIAIALDKLMRGTNAHESRHQTLIAIADVGAIKNEYDALNAVSKDAEWMHNLLETLLQIRSIPASENKRLRSIKANLSTLATLRNNH